MTHPRGSKSSTASCDWLVFQTRRLSDMASVVIQPKARRDIPFHTAVGAFCIFEASRAVSNAVFWFSGSFCSRTPPAWRSQASFLRVQVSVDLERENIEGVMSSFEAFLGQVTRLCRASQNSSAHLLAIRCSPVRHFPRSQAQNAGKTCPSPGTILLL